MNTCLDNIFKVQTYAGELAGLAGVIGAVIVAAIALRLGNPPTLHVTARSVLHDPTKADPAQAALDNVARPLLAMPAALVFSLLSAYGYAIISATVPCDLATELGFVVGGQLGVGAALLLFSIVWLLRDYETHGHAVATTRRLLKGIAWIIGFFLLIAVDDYQASRGQGVSILAILAVGLPLIAPLIVGTFPGFFGRRSAVRRVLVSQRRRLEKRSRAARTIGFLPATITFSLIVLFVGFSIEAWLNFGSVPPQLPLALWSLYGALIGLLLAAVLAQAPAKSDELNAQDFLALETETSRKENGR